MKYNDLKKANQATSKAYGALRLTTYTEIFYPNKFTDKIQNPPYLTVKGVLNTADSMLIRYSN